MSDRRTFLTTVTGSLASMAVGPVHPSPRTIEVAAEPTVFWRNPDGRANLVRFVVTGTDAPAGRLRVYDRARRLLGTAGMLPVATGLRGELWLRLDEPTSVLSELEAPGRRTPLRTGHRLVPPAKWTCVWLTVADPDELERRLRGLSALSRVVHTAIWREAGVTADPLPPAHRLHEMDHVQFLRAAAEPERVSAVLGLPSTATALVGRLDRYPQTTPLALSGAGIRHVVRYGDSGDPAWWTAPDGSRILVVPIAEDADPLTLGFADGGEAMARRMEAFFGSASSPTRGPTRVVVQAGLVDALPRMVGSVHEWNRNYAFPRIVIGSVDDIDPLPTASPDTVMTVPVPTAPAFPRPANTELERVVSERARTMDRHVEAMLAPIAALIDGTTDAPDAAQRISASLDTRVPGWLVVNPSPFRRTDVVHLPDGRIQLVTDVPGLGYAFVLDEGVAPQPAEPDAATSPSVAGAQLVATLDATSGAIRSLRHRRTGREWLRGGGGNDATAMLEAWEHRVVPGIATQLVVRRYSAYHGELQTTVTAYSRLPWIDVENRAERPEQGRMDYTFEFAIPDPTVRWEIPAGHREGRPPLRYVPYVRWLALDANDGSVLIGGPDTPYVAIGLAGRVEFPAAAGGARFRILTASATPSTADCARFGWDLEPLRIVPVAGSAGGSAERFGHAVVLDQPDAALIGLKQADDGDGIVAYVQNLTPDRRPVSVGFGLLAWSGARRVDLRERDIGEPTTPVPDGVAFDVLGHGVAAVRLTGVRLREG